MFLCAGCQYPTLVVYSAKWCGPCQADKPKVRAHSRTMRVKVIDVDNPNCKYKGEVPYYEHYTPDGKLIYKGHNIDKVAP